MNQIQVVHQGLFDGRSVSADIMKREEECLLQYSVPVEARGSGAERVKDLRAKGYRVGTGTEDSIISPQFTVTPLGTTNIVIVKGRLFEDQDRITASIRKYAENRGLQNPNPDIACVIREMVSDKEIEVMGLDWIVCMHEPIVKKREDSEELNLLVVSRTGEGNVLLQYSGEPEVSWSAYDGFAFIAPSGLKK